MWQDAGNGLQANHLEVLDELGNEAVDAFDLCRSCSDDQTFCSNRLCLGRHLQSHTSSTELMWV